MTDNTDAYNVIAEYLTSSIYTALSLSIGEEYNFSVQARNSHGYSLSSDTLTLLCAVKPSIPQNTITDNSGSDVIITWIAPEANGSPILSYSILIGKSDDSFSEELTLCDGADATIMANTQCVIS